MLLIKRVLIFFTSYVFAHEGHKKKKEVQIYDTLTIVNGDTIAINGLTKDQIESNRTKFNNAVKIHSEEDKEIKSVTLNSAFEHIHNKVIYYPIAITVIGILLMLFVYKDNKYNNALKIIIPFAAFFSILSILSGLSQATLFEGAQIYDPVETHKFLGFGVMASLFFWSFTLDIKIINKFIWLFAIITFTLVTRAGLYRGVIAH